jgi:hypothetical protein
MMRIWAGLPALFLAGHALAQNPPPPGIFRGTWVEWEGSESSGTFSVRTGDQQTQRCSFNSRTFFERDHKRVMISKLASGDAVEVLLDRIESRTRCMALILRVVNEYAGRPPSVYRSLLRGSRSPTETFAPRGHLTYSGVVVRVDERSMLLRTRTAGELTVLLRGDTRYSAEGAPVDRSVLGVNTRVFIRGGKTLENEVEAYAVMWGTILKP